MKHLPTFHDSHGNEVAHGDKIVIEHSLNFRHLVGQHFIVRWNGTLGMYRFHEPDRADSHGSDFYGVKFKLLTGPDGQ